jgi:hypothetical protein
MNINQGDCFVVPGHIAQPPLLAKTVYFLGLTCPQVTGTVFASVIARRIYLRE